MWAFCSTLTIVRFTLRIFWRSSRKPSICSVAPEHVVIDVAQGPAELRVDPARVLPIQPFEGAR
jgi:hypothetical protein